MTALSSLLARKGEALPAARRSGPDSWFDDDEPIAGAVRRPKGAPIDDETVEAADLVALITPMSLRAAEKPVQSGAQSSPRPQALKLEKNDTQSMAEKPRQRLFGGGPTGPDGFCPVVRKEDSDASEPIVLRRQMTLRLPMTMFQRLKDYVDGEDITYQRALSEAVEEYLESIVE